MTLLRSQMSKLIIRVPLVSLKNQFELQVRKSKEAKDFRVIAFSGKHYEMVHNYTHKDCAVRLKIISVNMSCNCQISPLERLDPSGSVCSHSVGVSALKNFKRPSGHRAGQWPQSRVCRLFHLQISLWSASTPQVITQLLSFHPAPFHSHSSYYH